MTSNQHYIPQFYQYYWECEEKGHIWEMDKRHRKNADKGIRMRAIRNRNSQEYLYEADRSNPNNAIDNWYGKFETIYAERYRKFINSRASICKITEEDKMMLCVLFANLSARNPKNLYENERNNVIASFFTLGEPNPAIDRRYMQNLVAFTEGEMIQVFGRDNEKDNPKMFGEFAGRLFSYNIQILVSKEQQIVFCDNIVEQVGYPEEYYFPIHPTMLAFFSGNNSYEDKIIRTITPEEYTRYIKLYQENNYVNRIYANRKRVLEDLL